MRSPVGCLFLSLVLSSQRAWSFTSPSPPTKYDVSLQQQQDLRPSHDFQKRGEGLGGSSTADERNFPEIFGVGGQQADASRIQSRRRAVIAGMGAIFAQMTVNPLGVASPAWAAEKSLPKLLALVVEARSQLDPVPEQIKEGKWDSVRALLIKPPLSDCWTKGSNPTLLKDFAEAVGELPEGDELAALEAREEARSHLRFLDMAVYNNVFNPIATEGEAGATKELIRSYYEDPKNELKASIAALDELIRLGTTN